MRNFADIVDHAMKNPQFVGLRPVVEKELLHYEILFALEREGLLEDLTFQGGTSLRLCRNAQRFSEDLDFVGGHDFAPAQLRKIRTCVERHIGKRYDLEIAVKEPREMREDPTYFGVKTDRWQIAVVTNPGRPDLPRQKIKFEVANVPAYTRETMSPMRNYEILPDGYDDILVPTETLEEIMADKVVSLTACTTYKRHRDIWDLGWLSQRLQREGDIDHDLVASLVDRKIQDYQIEDFEGLLSDRIATLGETVRSKSFLDEMTRFITPAARKRTFDADAGLFLSQLDRTVGRILKVARTNLYAKDVRPDMEFDMG